MESILKKELENNEALDKLLFSILSEEKQCKLILIRVGSEYSAHITEVIEDFKSSIGLKADITILEDKNLVDGKMIVERDNGKTTFTIDNSIEKLKEVLMEA